MLRTGELDFPVDVGTQPSRRWRIAAYPDYSNPYLRLFYGALEAHGIECVHWIAPDRFWAADLGGVDALHVHWPEGIWRRCSLLSHRLGRLPGLSFLSRAHPLIAQRSRVFALQRLLRKLRQRRVRVIWTLHNVQPHEDAGAVDELGFNILGRAADLIICHSNASRLECLRRYGAARNVVVMPMGNYDRVYPCARQRETVRHELGLHAKLPVVSCLGRLRQYKGLELACEAVGRLGGRVQLLIAGAPHPGFDLNDLQTRMARVEKAVLVPRGVSDQEFADFVGASDAVLLPYRMITGSSVLLAAWTLGCGVIASDLDFFREMLVGDTDAGTLFRVDDSQSLATAIRRYLEVPRARRERAAREAASRFAWSDCVLSVVTELNGWAAQRSPGAL